MCDYYNDWFMTRTSSVHPDQAASETATHLLLHFTLQLASFW